MKEQEIKSYQKKTQKDYSLAFKLEIVAAVEKGELTYKQPNCVTAFEAEVPSLSG